MTPTRAQWKIGEWLNFGEKQWGDTYERAAEITGYSVAMLYKISSVTTKTLSARKDSLSFNHHVEVMGLAAPEQERWLDKAEKEEWSTRELRDQLIGGAAA